MESEQKTVTITESELKLMIQTLVVCSKRGVFQLEEYNAISSLYTSLIKHIKVEEENKEENKE